MFSIEKLKWINSQYIKQKPTKELTDLLIPFLKEQRFIGENYDRKTLENIVNLYKGRLSTLVDFLDWTDFLFVEKLKIDPQLRQKYDLKGKAKEFGLLGERLRQVEDFSPKVVEESFRALVAELGMKPADLVHPMRVALTGKTIGPGLFDTMALLGKEKTLQRLQEAVK